MLLVEKHLEKLLEYAKPQNNSFEFIANHHKAKCFIDHSVRLIEEHLEKEKLEGREVEELILSFSIPALV